MKVLFVINAFGSPSGAEHVLIDYLKTENRIEPKFLVIGAHTEALLLFEQITDKDKIYHINVVNSIMSPLSRMLLFRLYRCSLCKKIRKSDVYKKLNRERDFDAIYFNNSFEAMAFYPLFPDAKKVIHIHDMIEMFRPAQKECIIAVSKKAQYIIAASNACAQMISRHGVDSQKISVAHNSIEIVPRPYDTQKSDILTIGFVGSAIHRKGFDLFVSIINGLEDQLKFNDDGIKKIGVLIITNTNENSNYLRENIQRINKRINISTYFSIQRAEVLSRYREMDLLLVPSRFDPLPTVVLEAYLMGVPVFGTAKDGMLEMQIDDRMMFEVDDVNSAINKIINWISCPARERKEVVSKTQHYITTEFTSEKKKNNVYSVLNNLVNGEKNVWR